MEEKNLNKEDLNYIDFSKEDFCLEISQKTSVPKEDVEKIINAFISHQLEVMNL
jgi:nucleoid DNA-binding protein